MYLGHTITRIVTIILSGKEGYVHGELRALELRSLVRFELVESNGSFNNHPLHCFSKHYRVPISTTEEATAMRNLCTTTGE